VEPSVGLMATFGDLHDEQHSELDRLRLTVEQLSVENDVLRRDRANLIERVMYLTNAIAFHKDGWHSDKENIDADLWSVLDADLLDGDR
jgi:hypothetical protein